MQNLSKQNNQKWILGIPENWEVKKLPWVCFFQEGPGLRNWQFVEEGGIPVVCVSNITLKGLDFKKFKRYISKEEYLNSYQHFRVRKNDLLLTSSGSIGKICKYEGEFDFEFILNTSTIRLHSLDEKIISTDFIKYLITSDLFQNQINLLITGSAQSNFGPSHLNQIRIPIPSNKEQKLISQYLDKKTQKIDSLIERIEKKIKLLKEQKTSLINQYVTKGLDPNVEMKDSGIEWIGEIPSDWNVLKINYLIDVKDGTHDTPDYVEDKGNAVPLVTSSHFSEGEIDFSTCKHISMKDHLEINKRSNVETGDILMSMIGSNIGSSAIIGENNKFSIKNVCLFKTSFQSNILPNYLRNLLNSKFLKYQVDVNQKGGGQPFLSLENLRNLKFPLPNKEEQQKINLVLSKQLNVIKKNQSLIKKKILLLQEYRQSLISSVVTGNILIKQEMI